MTAPPRPALPKMIRGSVIVHRRRCGRPTCRCTDGVQLHASTVLSYSQDGKTRFLMLPADRIDAVRASVARYGAARAALEETGNAGRAELIAMLAADRLAR